jgi:Flp pilus assembly CpaE family ATPase
MSKLYQPLKLSKQQSLEKRDNTSAVPELRSRWLDFRAEMISLSCRIDAAIPMKTPKIIQFISARSGEGTSELARQFANVSVKQLQKTALLVNAHPDATDYPEEIQRSLHRMLEMRKNGGFSDKLGKRFDLVIIDSPPLTEFPDSLLVSSKVDGVVLVMEAEKTSWRVTKDVKERIVEAGGNIVVLILNKRKKYLPFFLERYI